MSQQTSFTEKATADRHSRGQGSHLIHSLLAGLRLDRRNKTSQLLFNLASVWCARLGFVATYCPWATSGLCSFWICHSCGFSSRGLCCSQVPGTSAKWGALPAPCHSRTLEALVEGELSAGGWHSSNRMGGAICCIGATWQRIKGKGSQVLLLQYLRSELGNSSIPTGKNTSNPCTRP